MDIICPITQQIFNEPVIASDGFCYEKEAILSWLEKNNTSPMTREIIDNRLHPNKMLKSYITSYLEKYPDQKVNQYTFKIQENVYVPLDKINQDTPKIQGKVYNPLDEINDNKIRQVIYRLQEIYGKRSSKLEDETDESSSSDSSGYEDYDNYNSYKKYEDYQKYEDYEIEEIEEIEQTDNITKIIERGSFNDLLQFKDIDLSELYVTGSLQVLLKSCQDITILKHMIDNCIDLNVRDLTNSWCLIHYVCMYCKLDIIRYLVKKGVNMKSKTNNGFTPMRILKSNLQLSPMEKHKFIKEMINSSSTR